MRRIAGSLRTRLVALATLTTLVVLSAAAAIAIWQIHRVTDSALTDAARTRLAAVLDGLTPGGALGTTARVRRTATYAQVLDTNGVVVSASPALVDDAPLLPLDVARRGVRNPRLLNLNSPDIDLAVIAEPRLINGGRGAVIVGVDSQGFLDARRQLQVLVLFGVPLVVVLTAMLTWLVTGRAFRVVTRLAEDADALSVSDSGRGLSVGTDDAELARLVEALNRMLNRLSTHYATNLAAAAETTHRLRTPLATLRAEAELALLDDDPRAAHDALNRIIADTDRLTGLVDRLLSAASGSSDVRDIRTAIDLSGEDWQRQAAAHGRRTVVDCAAEGQVDAVLLHAVVDPLVENAIRYASDGEPVTVEIDGHGEEVLVRVSNRGDGVRGDLLDQLFQPWAGRSHGGLGLWLARESARSAGGDVWCAAPGPPTTTFVARLPVAAPESTPADTQPAKR